MAIVLKLHTLRHPMIFTINIGPFAYRFKHFLKEIIVCFITSAEGGCVLVVIVCLSIFVSTIIYKVMNGFVWNFYQRYVSSQSTIHSIWKRSGLVYDPDPIHNHCDGACSILTDCLILLNISMLQQIVPINLYRYCNV